MQAPDLMQIYLITFMLCYRCVRLLCKYNTDLKARVNEKEDTALHIAARNDYCEILHLLLGQGLDPELRYCHTVYDKHILEIVKHILEN